LIVDGWGLIGWLYICNPIYPSWAGVDRWNELEFGVIGWGLIVDGLIGWLYICNPIYLSWAGVDWLNELEFGLIVDGWGLGLGGCDLAPSWAGVDWNELELGLVGVKVD
jgi:hypothetical protein